jgi:hypothetical protein
MGAPLRFARASADSHPYSLLKKTFAPAENQPTKKSLSSAVLKLQEKATASELSNLLHLALHVFTPRVWSSVSDRSHAGVRNGEFIDT